MRRPYTEQEIDQSFWVKVDKDGPVPEFRSDLGQCWIWKAAINDGYGYFRHKPAYWYSYSQKYGPIPTDLVCDHLCRVRSCVNPDHLELVTHEENKRRGSRIVCRKPCKRGHSMDDAFIRPDGHPVCRICTREWSRNQRKPYKRKAA